jgi:hypothetical protein
MNMNYQDIPVVIKPVWGPVDVEWRDIVENWTLSHRGIPVELQPDFQRSYVWTQAQQISYIENMLRGFPTGRDIYFNHPTWKTFEDADKYPLQCLDGQQRIGAVVEFMENRLPIFDGNFFKDIDGYIPWSDRAHFNICISNMKSRRDVISAYINLNFAGTAHTSDEKDRLVRLLEMSDN